VLVLVGHRQDLVRVTAVGPQPVAERLQLQATQKV
jgi:hypothetical protein